MLQEIKPRFRSGLIPKAISITLMTNKGPITLVLKVFCISSTVAVSMVFCGNTAALFTSRFKPFFPSREPTFLADSPILHGSATSNSSRKNVMFISNPQKNVYCNVKYSPKDKCTFTKLHKGDNTWMLFGQFSQCLNQKENVSDKKSCLRT